MIRIDREKVAFGVSRFNAGGCVSNCTWFYMGRLSVDVIDLPGEKLIIRWKSMYISARLRKVEVSASSS